MKLFRTYIVLTLAMLITLSASGITISLHKCCGSIKGFSLFANAHECEMAKKPAPKNCPQHSKSSVEKKSCCTDQKIVFTQSTDKTFPATAKNQVKETKQNFDVLFFLYPDYKLVWFIRSGRRRSTKAISRLVYH